MDRASVFGTAGWGFKSLQARSKIKRKFSLSINQSEILADAYAYCLRIAREHYENFPVASLLVPKRLRKHIAAIYAFARYADDLADEGDVDSSDRLDALRDWREKLETDTDHPIFMALRNTIHAYTLPIGLFHDLLDAFEQDAVRSEYETFGEVESYCTKSANPIGRLLLHLFRCANPDTLPASDALCTGLQLTNFWQDITIDAQKPRIYLPMEDLRVFGVTRRELHNKNGSEQFKKLIRFQVERTRKYFDSAKPLFAQVPFGLRLELRAIWRGGMRILSSIEKIDFDPLAQRPQLRWKDKAAILLFSPLPVREEGIAYA